MHAWTSILVVVGLGLSFLAVGISVNFVFWELVEFRNGFFRPGIVFSSGVLYLGAYTLVSKNNGLKDFARYLAYGLGFGIAYIAGGGMLNLIDNIEEEAALMSLPASVITLVLAAACAQAIWWLTKSKWLN